MCDELREELDEAGKHARALAEHVRRMGADSCRHSIIVEDKEYVVTVAHKPVEPLKETP